MELLGSDLQFVTKPSRDYFCPVCTEILTDPQLSDCGHHLCGRCRDRLLAGNKAECPECREPDVLKSARLNKHLQRQVKDLAVYCIHHEEGCKWKGELSNLREHLDPANRHCGYVRVPCSFQCGELVRSGAVKEHKRSHCRKRPYTCKYCGYHNALDVVTERHMPACRQFPVDCPNNCETNGLKRYQLQSHIKQCPLEIVPCSFSSIGCTCNTRLPRKEMKAHEEQTWRQHLELVLKAIEPKQEETATIVTPPPLDTLDLVNLPPVKFTIMDYVERKLAGEEWVSPPFYSHPQGYKMCLEVASTNDQENLSVYVYVLQGEYDDELIWPFEGRVSVELVNWKEDKGHHEENFGINIILTDYSLLHVSKNDSKSIAGKPHFIPHSSLSYDPASNTEYLHDDCLCVRVKSVDVYSTQLVHKTPAWHDTQLAPSMSAPLCEFTIAEFSKRKQVDNRFYSPSFYTHQNGFEMCVVVDANGSRAAKDSHISVFVAPAVKKNDRSTTLQPFECDAVVELLNWKEDKEHYSRTISLHGNSLYMHNNAFGTSIIYCQFIKHTSLSFDPATNTEYLQDDCLRMRVKSVEFYSTPATCSLSEQSPLLEITLTEFSKRRRQFNNVFHSSPFYSHPQGYKLCLRCNANDKKKTHLTVSIYLMRGEHDDHLHWPCDCSIGVELVNCREDKGHLLKWANIVSSRVINSNIADTGKGWCQLVSHASLTYDPTTNTEYLQDDCLRLRVVGVEVYSTDLLLKTPSWQNSTASSQSVCEFTLTKFSKRKQCDNVYYSPAFYTHKKGYKMCIQVRANGYGNGKGSHISVYIYHMKGEHDDKLYWPFQGDIVLEVQNWREDKRHYKMRIECNDVNQLYTNRVTETNMADGCWGEAMYIPHTALIHEHTNNIEYVQDDCLRLKVSEVNVYSGPLMFKTPAWQDSSATIKPLLEFTLTELTKRKDLGSKHIYSNTFYSHTQGYKLILVVLPNVDGIIICAILLNGNHDEKLEWPARFNFTIELLNWRENKKHIKAIATGPTNKTYYEVIEGSWLSIPYSLLQYNPLNNTEYLQDDCLRLRVLNND